MLNSHTHCQVAQADPQTKTWQRVCLPQRTDKEKTTKAQLQLPVKSGSSGFRWASFCPDFISVLL